MTWPSGCIRGVDLSYYQSSLNVAEFVKKNPTVEKYVLRAVWPSQALDQAFRGFYDALRDAGKAPGAYFWPNPGLTLAQVEKAWKSALLSRVPAFVAVDFEWSQVQWKNAGVTPTRTITEDARETLRMAVDMFGENVIVYTRGLWWDENIREHGWEKDYKFWIAHYPTIWRDNTSAPWRQARDFTEIELATDAGAVKRFPYLGENIPPANVVGWQFGDHGRLPGYNNNLDLSLWIPQTPPQPTLEQRVAALEATAHSH